MSTPDKEALRDQFERAYATELHTTGGRNKWTIDELVEVIKTWRNGDNYDNDLPRLQFGWEGFQWHAPPPPARPARGRAQGPYLRRRPHDGLPRPQLPAFHTAAAQLREQGWHVENPQTMARCRRRVGRLHARGCRHAASCGAIYLLPGWSKSRGGSVEAMLAHWLAWSSISPRALSGWNIWPRWASGLNGWCATIPHGLTL